MQTLSPAKSRNTASPAAIASSRNNSSPTSEINDQRASTALQMKQQEGMTQPASPGTPVIQRKILVGKTWYSFQNVYDNRGNPYLIDKDKNNMQLAQKQNGIVLNNVDDTYNDLNEDTMENVYKNFHMGRPMNLQTPGGNKSMFLPSKDYKYNPQTQYDISIFPNENTKGYKYDELYEQSRLKKNSNDIDFDKFHDNEEEMYNNMEPIIYGEEYRQKGALEDYKKRKKKATKKVKEIEEDVDMTNKEKRKGINKQMNYVTNENPWAGSGGKKKYKKDKEDEEQRDYTPQVWYGNMSPMRDEENDINIED